MHLAARCKTSWHADIWVRVRSKAYVDQLVLPQFVQTGLFRSMCALGNMLHIMVFDHTGADSNLHRRSSASLKDG